MNSPYDKIMVPVRYRLMQLARNKYYQSMNQKIEEKVNELEKKPKSIEGMASKLERIIDAMIK